MHLYSLRRSGDNRGSGNIEVARSSKIVEQELHSKTKCLAEIDHSKKHTKRIQLRLLPTINTSEIREMNGSCWTM